MPLPKKEKEFVLDWKQVGRRIRELRGFDTNQAELAAAIGVAQSYISAIERGLKEPGAATLYRIARKYGTTVDWLLIGSDADPGNRKR